MERAKLDAWFVEADKVLLEEETVLEGLKMAVAHSEITQDQADKEMFEAHQRICPDVQGRDL
jgi:hypothetical protein